MAIDEQNSCKGLGASATTWFHYFILKQYTGEVTAWKQKFDEALAEQIKFYPVTAYQNNGQDTGNYQAMAVIDAIKRPGTTVLQIVPGVQIGEASNGNYTLTWTPPAGATGTYRVKYSGKRMVEWIGYNAYTATYIGDPTTTDNWFAGMDATGAPTCATTCSLTVNT